MKINFNKKNPLKRGGGVEILIKIENRINGGEGVEILIKI